MLKVGDMVRLTEPESTPGWAEFRNKLDGVYYESVVDWYSYQYLEVLEIKKHPLWPYLVAPPKFLRDLIPVSEELNSGKGIYVTEDMLIKVTEEELREEVEQL